MKVESHPGFELFERKGQPVPVKGNRGDDLALFLPEIAYTPDPTHPVVRVPVYIFRDQPMRFVYAASLGHTVLVVEESGPSFVILPPIKYRNGVSPDSLGCWWVEGRHQRAGDRELPGTLDPATALMDLAARSGAIESKIDKIAVEATEAAAKAAAIEARLDRLGVPKTRRRRKLNRKPPSNKPTDTV